MKKRHFMIKLYGDKYNIYLRNHPDHPLDKNGFPDKKSAKKRLKQYLKNVKENSR